MPCLNCGSSPTIDAHLIPRSFALEVTDERGEQHAIAFQHSPIFRKSNTGLYDTAILCAPCDQILGQNEKYVLEFLRAARLEPANHHSVCHRSGDGDKFVRFAAGIAWKFSVTRPEYGRIGVGPYASALADAAFGKAAIAANIDLIVFRLLTGNNSVPFYRLPRTDRQEGINFVRFCVGSFLFLLKIDRRTTGSPPFNRWLKGVSIISYECLAASLFEEWKVGAQIAARPRVRSYLDRMRRRPTAAG